MLQVVRVGERRGVCLRGMCAVYQVVHVGERRGVCCVVCVCKHMYVRARVCMHM